MTDEPAGLTKEDFREFFIRDLLKLWREEEQPFYSRSWDTVARTMQFVGNYKGWSGADKKAEVLEILSIVLDQTDSPGPDFIVDRFIQQAAEWGIDYLYKAFKGEFSFDGPPDA